MIKLDIVNVFLVYIGILLFGVFVTSINIRKKSIFKKKVKKEDRIVFACQVCTYKYIVNSDKLIHECPQCGSLNKVV